MKSIRTTVGGVTLAIAVPAMLRLRQPARQSRCRAIAVQLPGGQTMDQASPSGAPRRPSGPELLKEIWHVVQDLPVFLTTPLYRRWHLHWGATAVEAAAKLPGDNLVPAAQYCATRAITIDAPASEVWPWLVQVGCVRGGFYSDDLLDNLTRPSATTIIPEFQHLEVGQLVPMAPPGRASERTAFRVHSFRVNEWLLWSKPDSTWAWSVTSTGTGGTRLVARIRAWYDWQHPLAGLSAALLMEFGDFAMLRRMLRGIKARAESRRKVQPGKPGRQVRGEGH